MGSILMDEETGDPALDPNNNTIPVHDEMGFQQIIDGLFHCDVGSERWNPYYGFDLRSAIRESGTPNSEMFIESLVIQALNSNVEKLISTVEDLRAVKDGRNMNVTVIVSSILNDSVIFEQSF